MTTRKCNYHPYIDSYMDGVRDGSIIAGEDIHLAMDYIEIKLNDPDVFIDTAEINKAIELMERYFEIKLFDWELFVVACIHCFYKSDDTVVFSVIFIMEGRGNGKNGFISPVCWYLTTHYHGITGYNIDIVANAEDQAKTSFLDVYEVLERTWAKSKRFFYKTKEIIINLRTNSYIKFNTSNARTKDSKRTGCLIFDEVHGYQNYEQIKVFTSGFGKRKHSRAFYITTQGDVRDGVLDDMLAIAKDILRGVIKELRWLPLIYRIDNENEAKDPVMWNKANPSLKYLPTLQLEMEQQFIEMKYQPPMEAEFYTKRMNWPKQNRESIVAEWKNIKETNQEMPDLLGRECICGIDYANVNDFASVNLHFRKGDFRYDINHSWLCLQSKDLHRLVVPWREWAELDYITLVDDVEIHPDLLCNWIMEQMKQYQIKKIALDNFRYALFSRSLEAINFDAKEQKNVKLIRPSDIMKIQPVINSVFTNNRFIWGDNPVLRWAVNNTKLIRSGYKTGNDTGNFVYGKIEAKSRKTDPFMALVASMILEDELYIGESIYADIPIIQ